MEPVPAGQQDPSVLAIIEASTSLAAVPLVPEIRIRQASEPIALWQDTEQSLGLPGLEPPFWAFAWAGGRALARYLLDHPDVVRGRRVLDVASGSGLVAIAAALAGAAEVRAVDIDPLAIAAIAMNARANGVAVRTICADILTAEGLVAEGPVAHDRAAEADVVLVADAFYQRELAEKVTRYLEGVRARGAAVLAGDFGRTYLPRAKLVAVASYDVPGLLELEGSEIKHTTVWTLAG